MSLDPDTIRKGPKVTRDDKILLWNLLANGQWMKAKDLAPHWGNKPGNTRIIRAICESEPHRFVSTQQGYKRFDKATDAEIGNAIADLRSRSAKMTERADAIEQALYERQVPEQMRMVK